MSLDEISAAREYVKRHTLRHGSCSRQVDLALDLLSSPTGGIDGARTVLPVRPRFPNQRSNPVLPEVSSKLAIGESLSKVTGSG